MVEHGVDLPWETAGERQSYWYDNFHFLGFFRGWLWNETSFCRWWQDVGGTWNHHSARPPRGDDQDYPGNLETLLWWGEEGTEPQIIQQACRGEKCRALTCEPLGECRSVTLLAVDMWSIFSVWSISWTVGAGPLEGAGESVCVIFEVNCFETTDSNDDPILKCIDNRRLLALKLFAATSGRPVMVNIDMVNLKTLSVKQVKRIMKNCDDTDGNHVILRASKPNKKIKNADRVFAGSRSDRCLRWFTSSWPPSRKMSTKCTIFFLYNL